MPECRYTLLKSGRAELEEKKSRFLAQSFFVRSEAEIAEILAAVRKEHYDARHVCSAYVLFGNPPLEKSSDDGEPAKTAGLPMLDLLRAASLCNTLVTVTRYFGGIKLGAGGLVRAYTDTVATALQQAERVPIIRQVVLGCRVGYELEGALRRELAAREGVLLDVAHAADVSVQLQLPEPQAEAFRTWLDDAGHGRVQWFEPEKADEA